MSSRQIQVTNSELEVLKFIWKSEPVPSGSITHEMKLCNNWHPSTSKTLIKRLLDKQTICYSTVNRQRYYSAIISEQEFLLFEIQRIMSGMNSECIAEISSYLAKLDNSNKMEVIHDNKT
ncbi:BlaI/MecI/CopY family transcriptional regulator [Enterococcus faecalis]|uniref:BlaI/MecI/CopY family transcriptional regulator n=1 Tax=Enterococcus faecalis TaxID=1351 RepID=UPI0035CA666E